jgi:hypothetical protein
VSNNRPTSEEIAFRGLANYQAPTDADIQRGASMADVVRHDTRNVHNRGSPAADSGRVRGTGGSENGWVEPKPLGLPPGVALIDQLCDVMLPHGPKSGAK